ncbi:5-formyltetrahydrofolate cyclo-ligase [Planococcus antarcticus DSM 14505]|uniref:5-formyltetrahydrofolate cyclo-ligase n=1 Tax=Planococcus antarcticus DSM 14505 TaxID=1185653 RepID=A0ABM6D8A3_9BACL|nr:5-formyltetrahydrofolate cyclo-ligase [Planococcus antarcticus]ANU11174.1 5-formyltetrahydrofolate cyclo-ligase [Planococcus antarcticus DSM 14505]
MDKVMQRKKVLAMLNQMTLEEYRKKSETVISRLLEDPVFVEADTIGMTLSAFPEVDTFRLLEICWAAGKKVATPKCHPASRGMDFRVIEHKDQLEVVYMKLQEPIVSTTTYVKPNAIDLLIVPGVVFSKQGFRIGFGGGYYDRFLANYTGATRSLAFDRQIAESIPVESHDLPVQGIYTESGFILTKAVDE